MTSNLEWVLNRMNRRGPLPPVDQIVTTSVEGLSVRDGMDADDARYEDVKRRRGRKVADAVAALADRAPQRMPVAKRWEWAERKYDDRDEAAAAGTGYDPDDVYRSFRGEP